MVCCNNAPSRRIKAKAKWKNLTDLAAAVKANKKGTENQEVPRRKTEAVIWAQLDAAKKEQASKRSHGKDKGIGRSTHEFQRRRRKFDLYVPYF